MLAITVTHNDVEFALRLLKRQLQNPGCSGSSGGGGSPKNPPNGGVNANARASGRPGNVRDWRMARARHTHRRRGESGVAGALSISAPRGTTALSPISENRKVEACTSLIF